MTNPMSLIFPLLILAVILSIVILARLDRLHRAERNAWRAGFFFLMDHASKEEMSAALAVVEDEMRESDHVSRALMHYKERSKRGV